MLLMAGRSGPRTTPGPLRIIRYRGALQFVRGRRLWRSPVPTQGPGNPGTRTRAPPPGPRPASPASHESAWRCSRLHRWPFQRFRQRFEGTGGAECQVCRLSPPESGSAGPSARPLSHAFNGFSCLSFHLLLFLVRLVQTTRKTTAGRAPKSNKFNTTLV